MKEDDLIERYRKYKGPTWTQLCEMYPYHLNAPNANKVPAWVRAIADKSPDKVRLFGYIMLFKDQESYVMAKMELK